MPLTEAGDDSFPPNGTGRSSGTVAGESEPLLNRSKNEVAATIKSPWSSKGRGGHTDNY